MLDAELVVWEVDTGVSGVEVVEGEGRAGGVVLGRVVVGGTEEIVCAKSEYQH